MSLYSLLSCLMCVSPLPQFGSSLPNRVSLSLPGVLSSLLVLFIFCQGSQDFGEGLLPPCSREHSWQVVEGTTLPLLLGYTLPLVST